jgi:4-diphosphocytidyl-2-C-methyl-D-erythritol kinase
VVLAKLPVSVSTVSVYQGLKWDQVTEHPNTAAMLAAMEAEDVEKMGSLLCNVLETVTIKTHPRIAEIKKRLVELGAAGALMSGSGPTVFGLFSDRGTARKAAEQSLWKPTLTAKEFTKTQPKRQRQEEMFGRKREVIYGLS